MLELSNKSGAEFLAAFKDEIDEELNKAVREVVEERMVAAVRIHEKLERYGKIDDLTCGNDVFYGNEQEITIYTPTDIKYTINNSYISCM